MYFIGSGTAPKQKDIGDPPQNTSVTVFRKLISAVISLSLNKYLRCFLEQKPQLFQISLL